MRLPFELRALVLTCAIAMVSLSASCARDSYLVVTLQGDAASDVFAMVGRIEVIVKESNGGRTMTLEYPTSAAVGGTAAFTFDSMTTKTLSISFTPSRSGPVDIIVNALDLNLNCIGSAPSAGDTSLSGVPIKKGDVSNVTARLKRGAACPAPPTDGGTSTDGNVTFTGCDPAAAMSCPGTQTCFINCATQKGECVPGGTHGPGEACNTNSDCMPGTQCFNYDCGQNIKICLKFCNTDGQCASGEGAGGAGGTTGGLGGAAGAGGAGTGTGTGTGGSIGTSACRDPVVCPTLTTSYKTCNFACDPRGDGTAGCPAGLTCFLYKNPAGGQDTADCGCREATRVRTDGDACASSVDCAPGFICNMMNGTQVCRRLCGLSSPTDCPATQSCRTLTNNTYGVCL